MKQRPPAAELRQHELDLALTTGIDVSCFLRSASLGIHSFKHGTVSLEISSVTWKPFWLVRAPQLQLPRRLAVNAVVEVPSDNWQIKAWLFKILECEGDVAVDLAIPTASVPLVTEYFLT